MAPSSPAPTSSSAWEPSTIIELLALTLTVPGAISALITLYVIRSHHQKKKLKKLKKQRNEDYTSACDLELGQSAYPFAHPLAHPSPLTITALDDSDSTTGLIHRFNERLRVLCATTAERREWEDELALGKHYG